MTFVLSIFSGLLHRFYCRSSVKFQIISQPKHMLSEINRTIAVDWEVKSLTFYKKKQKKQALIV